MEPEIAWYGAAELARRIAAGEVSPVEATELALARAETLGRRLNAFTVLDPEGARKAARKAERVLSKGDRAPGPLHGVPITIKDLLDTRDLPTTAGSRVPPHPPRRDATVVRRLRRAGAIVIGKTNLNEFAYGVTGENAHFGDVPNPWDPGRMAGGSSSGSAAALAAGIGHASVGTDTRGSVRIPAAACGVSGFKPSRGLVSTAGVYPLSRTLDHTGPLTRSVEDVALMLEVMAGSGRAHPFGGGHVYTHGYAEALEARLERQRIGLCPFFFRDVDDEVAGAVRAAAAALEASGLQVLEIDVPELDDSLRASAAIAAAEALDVHHERVQERQEGYSPALLGRLEAAYSVTGLDLIRSERVRQGLVTAYRKAFQRVDCMLGPTLPGLPPLLGSTTMQVGGGREEWIVDASCRLVAPQNMTGVPAISLPCGFSRGGLPIGLQIWSGTGGDALVLAVAHRYQEASEWHLRRPDVAANGRPRRAGRPAPA